MKLRWFILALLPANAAATSQTFNVQGNVSTDVIQVRYASVTFIDQGDTSKRFSALTDTLGNYHLTVLTGVKDNKPTLPSSIKLAQNYPNPFSSSTAIAYELNKQSHVSIRIFDILGREVRALRVSSEEAGIHGVLWDGTNNLDQTIAPGVYFYLLQTQNEKHINKMIFAGRSTKKNMPPLVGFSSAEGMGSRNVLELKRNIAVQLEQGIFKVKVTSTQSTQPKTLATEFPDVIVRQDTIIDFHVQLGITAYSLCYQREDTVLHSFALYLNNITGTIPKRITSYQSGYDYTPVWSPDGNYIAFTQAGAPFRICLYDTKNDTTAFLTPDSLDVSTPSWTPDSRHVVYGSRGPHFHMIDRDGSNNRDLPCYPDYFYSDSYTFLYKEGKSIYLSNLDGTVNDEVFDLSSVGTNYVKWYDFDPYTHRILILADPVSQITNLLLIYNVDSRSLDTVAIADSSCLFLRPKFSSDYSKVAVVKMNGFQRTQTLCLFQDGTETDLVTMTNILIERFSFYPLAFSPDDEYVAYSTMSDSGGGGFCFSQYVVELMRKEVTFIDEGAPAMWNPLKRH